MSPQLLQVVNTMWCLKLLFVLLKISIDSSSAQTETAAVDLTCLQTVCAVDCEASEIESLPANNLCSAIASYSNDTHVKAELIGKLRGELPYVFVLNNYCYEEIIANIKADKLEEFLNTVCALIKDNQISALVFDNMYPDVAADGGAAEDNALEADITTFLQKVKEREPTVLLGLAVSKNTEILNACGCDVTKLNGLVDFYLVKTHSYRECEFEENQTEPPITSPIDLMQETLTLLTTLQYDLCKTIITIDIRVTSKPADSKIDESYSKLCQTEPVDPPIKYCQDTLENYYKKGALVGEFKMAGVLLRSVDRDDFDDSCACGPFSATTVVAAAARGEAEPADVIGCETFAVFSNATQSVGE